MGAIPSCAWVGASGCGLAYCGKAVLKEPKPPAPLSLFSFIHFYKLHSSPAALPSLSSWSSLSCHRTALPRWSEGTLCLSLLLPLSFPASPLHVLHFACGPPVSYLRRKVLFDWNGHTHLTDVKAETQGGLATRPVPAAGFPGACSAVRQACRSAGVVVPGCPGLTFPIPPPVAVPQA